MTTAVIVQARMASTRLPGKIAMPLNGHTVLEEVLRRARAIETVDVVVCATTELAEDDRVVSLVERAGAKVVRGNASDVLGRYRKAAEAVDAEVVMRITADCPLVDPTLCGEVLKRRAESGAEYVANNMPPSFPHGLDCEAFTVQALMQADEAATEAGDREHVTPWLRRAAHIRREAVVGPGGRALEHRWTLDYAEDYEFLRATFSLLPAPPAIPGWPKVAALLETHPDILALNAARRV